MLDPLISLQLPHIQSYKAGLSSGKYSASRLYSCVDAAEIASRTETHAVAIG